VKADIKRCLDMREAYALLDYEDASIATCRLVLVHAMMSPQFLRAAPGRRFIAFACTLQPQMVRGWGGPVSSCPSAIAQQLHLLGRQMSSRACSMR